MNKRNAALLLYCLHLRPFLADFNICPHLLVAWKGQQQVGRIDASSHHPRLYYFFLTSKVMLGGWNFSLSERERERAHKTELTILDLPLHGGILYRRRSV